VLFHGLTASASIERNMIGWMTAACLDGRQLQVRRCSAVCSLERLEERPMQISLSRTVAARPPAAFAILADIAKWPAIIGSVRDVELLTPGPVRVGTGLRILRIMFGRETTEEMEIVEMERPHRLRLAADNHDLHYERDHIVDAVRSAGSRLTLIYRSKPSTQVGRALLPLITPVMEINLRDELEQDLADLAAAISAMSSQSRNTASG
jgi:hypothetical protein